MTTTHCHLAFDLGAESGRAIVGVIHNNRLTLHEIHRFTHSPVTMGSRVYWDLTGIFREIKTGLAKAGDWCRSHNQSIESLGVDTWGVDFGIVGEGGCLSLPRCYRDPEHARTFPRIASAFGKRAIFEATGVQPMWINTLYQVFAHELLDPPTPGKLLFTPDLLHHLLGAEPCNEVTIASTSQMLDARTARWSPWIMQRTCEMDRSLLTAKLVMPGTRIGRLDPSLASEAGLHAEIDIITPACHDTASAVAGVPATHGRSWCYLSSGTWSLMGVELAAPIINDAAFDAGFSNELGVAHLGRPTARFQKNITGLWMVQECRRDFERACSESAPPAPATPQHSLGYEELTAAAALAPAFRTLLNVNRPEFLEAGGMCAKITAYAKATNQPLPATPGEFVRACLESLALEYRRTLAQLESILARRIDVLHIVGGGGKNRLLNQMTADATGRTIIVGPVEATAAGNVLVQAMGAGHVRDLAALREIVRGSFEPETFEPRDTNAWDAADARAHTLLRSPG